MAPLCSPLGKCPFPQHSPKAGMCYFEKDTSYLHKSLFWCWNWGGGGQVPLATLPPGSTALDHGQVLTWSSLPPNPSPFWFSTWNEPQLFLIWLQLLLICMPINEFEWPQRRDVTNGRIWMTIDEYHCSLWQIVALIGAICNLIAELLILSDQRRIWILILYRVAFRAKLNARNVKLIGESLKLTGKTYS